MTQEIRALKPHQKVRIGDTVYEVLQHQGSGTLVRLAGVRQVKVRTHDGEEVEFQAPRHAFVISSGAEVSEVLL